ncbi:MAG: T9SS C-terminal target domain-containing protein, partial [Flavobacteriaceae bacterium]|nr:T9SS C-terminal target domain-containing protein [Flavobacteriaceae bacterium]
MKKNLLLSVTLASVLVLRGQVKDVELTLQPTYTHQVYFQFGTDNQVSIPAATWDIAFLRISPYAFATRVNDSRIRVFQVANSASQWNLIYIANEASWTELYNSETVWNKGAFDNGSATYGWGEYNSNTHHVVGSIVYVLKYTDNTYRKFMIDDFSSGYTCKYSTWDGSSWGADQTVIVSNSSGTERFNYYSLVDNQQVNSSIP